MSDPQPEVWVYAGTRLTGGKRTHAWQDPSDGQLRYWPGRGSYVVGAQYTLRIDRRDGATYRTGEPVFADRDGADPEQILAWEVETERVEHQLARERAERHAKTQGSAIDQAAAGVCGLARQVKSYTELEVLIAAVRRRMMDAWDAS